jgi:hypothetical protein|tara:strand:- start:5975 stop:6079 length:105 start_codon:yes stop_codon:yes gene_type:complete
MIKEEKEKENTLQINNESDNIANEINEMFKQLEQ